METLCRDLMREWCESLLRLQIKGTGDKRMDGGILCPACGRIHGRCAESMYPFMRMAAQEGKEQRKLWTAGAKSVFSWAKNMVGQRDGSFLNDIDSDWKGTTVFFVVSLAECLRLYGDLLDRETKREWEDQLRETARFLLRFHSLLDNNINYPISNGLALFLCGRVLGEEAWIEKAEELVEMAGDMLTENGLIYGEGVPRERRSRRGCRPVDIGYNVEETLPNLAMYGKLKKDQKICRLAKKSLKAHLEFMMEDGGWDNSFGTRNYKWSYWGSRTCDGCGLGYLLFADEERTFRTAARQNIQLLRECTVKGLLMGGPHYEAAGQAPCVHHTFTHAKVLAGILDAGLEGYLDADPEGDQAAGPEEGIRYFPEISCCKVRLGPLYETVSASDWEYLPGGHAQGGTLSMVFHRQAGPLMCSGICRYTLKEPANMQIPYQVRHECLALRIEREEAGEIYSSVYEDCPQVEAENNRIRAKGRLKNIRHEALPGGEGGYEFEYVFEEHRIRIKAVFTRGKLICPVISREDEEVREEKEKDALSLVEIKKKVPLSIKLYGAVALPYGKERIFNLIPGFQALRIDVEPELGVAEIALAVPFKIKRTV